MVITLIAISFLLLVSILILLFRKDMKRAGQIYSQKYKERKATYDTPDLEKEEMLNELKRMEIIIRELKAQNKAKVHQSLKEKPNFKNQKLELQRQKQIIEQEKEHFREKNKKLWEQSIAIHKEKEHINELRKKVETKHKEVIDSINYALRIQKALVTHKEYLEQYLTEFFIFWRPRNVVSGDFYWAKSTPKGLLIVVSDCTGHGVPGAFMSLLGISYLNEIIAHNTEIQPKDILENLRFMIKKSLQQREDQMTNKDGMDMICVLIEKENKILTYAGANNPLWLVNNDELIEYKAIKNPVGIFIREKKFEQTEIKYNTGDIIYMASDGFQDQFGGKNNTKFKKNRLKDLLAKLSHQRLSMHSIEQEIATEFDSWKGEASQTDDVLLMGIRL